MVLKQSIHSFWGLSSAFSHPRARFLSRNIGCRRRSTVLRNLPVSVGSWLRLGYRALFSSTLGRWRRRLSVGCSPSQPGTLIGRLWDEANSCHLNGFYDSFPCPLDVKCAAFLNPPHGHKAAARFLRKLGLTPAEEFSRCPDEGSRDFFRHKEAEMTWSLLMSTVAPM
jgi:hypothetical protein